MKQKITTLCFVCTALFFFCDSARSTETGAVKDSEVGMLDDAHKKVSERLSDLVGQLDGFFGHEEETSSPSESWAKLRIDLKDREAESPELKAKVKLKLVLPSAENRLRLLFSSGEDDAQPSNSQSNSDLSGDSTDDESAALALRFLRKIRKNSSLKFDLGARVRDGSGQVFFRVGGQVQKHLGLDWWGTLSNDAIYFSKSGYENTLNLKFKRYVDRDDQVLFLSGSQVTWEEHKEGAHIDQTIGLYRELDDNRSIAVETLLGINTSPEEDDHRSEGPEFRVRFRHNVWREWFFYELWPSISWPQDRDYNSTFGGMLRVEAVFGPMK